MPAGVKAIPVRAIQMPEKLTRLAEVIHLGIRHKISPSSSSKMSGMSSSHKLLSRWLTVMMMVTRLWRKPGIRDMKVHWDPGWDLASCHQMMHDTSWTGSICPRCWKSKVHLALHALDLGS